MLVAPLSASLVRRPAPYLAASPLELMRALEKWITTECEALDAHHLPYAGGTVVRSCSPRMRWVAL